MNARSSELPDGADVALPGGGDYINHDIFWIAGVSGATHISQENNSNLILTNEYYVAA